jgi:S1-C subfamily serine protease
MGRGFLPALFLVVAALAPACPMAASLEAPAPILLAQAETGTRTERGTASAQSLNAAVVSALDQLGYRAGAPRDEPDRTLRAAIKAFQRDQGLPQSGKISKRLVSAIATELNRRHIALHGGSGSAATANSTLRPVASGTGIVVDSEGHVLTNHHVIRDCQEMRVGERERIDVAAIDSNADLALLKLRTPRATFATFRDGNSARPGEEVVVLGYPLYGLLSADVIVTTGSINALAGIRNDRSQIQISAPTQPGNSGGPVLDSSGNLVGIVVSGLDAAKIASVIGVIPENVNFAISEATARRFLDAEHVHYRVAPSSAKFAAPDIAEKGTAFTLLLECWSTHPPARE